MKKLITSLFVIVAMMLPLMTQAQTHYNVVVSSQGTTNGYVPDYTYYNYSFSQNIISSNALGISGEIDTLWYYVNSGSATRTIFISMAEMGKSSFASSTDVIPTSAFTQVYAGTITWSSGWVGIPLDTPFDYQDTANLIIMVRDSTGSYVSAQQFSGSTGSGNVSLYQYQDGGPCSPEVAGLSKGINSFTPYMRIGINSYDVYCAPLDGLSVSFINANDATVIINDGGDASAWDVIVSDTLVTDFESVSYSSSYSTDYVAYGLDANSTYYAYARANCGSNVSGWYGPVAFTTACDGSTPIPFSTNFDLLSTGGVPNCWTQLQTSAGAGNVLFPCAYSHSPNAHSGNIYFEFETNNGQREAIALPEMDNISSLRMDFYARYANGNNPVFEVGVMEDTTFVVVDTIVGLTESYQHISVYFGNYQGYGNRIAMRTYRNGQNYTLFIDDLDITVAPTCSSMPSTPWASNIDSASAELHWRGVTDGYYALYLNNDHSWHNAYDTTYTFTGLNSSTNYSGLLYHVCAAGDTSDSRAFSFRTDCGALNLPYFDDFESHPTNIPDCWTVLQASGSYPLINSGTTHSGNNRLSMYGSSSDVSIATPKIYEPLNTLEVKFWAKKSSSSANIDLQVGYTTSIGADPVYFATINLASDYTEHTVALDTIAESGYGYIVFKKPAGGSYYAYIDDVTIRTVSNCADPENFVNTGTATGELSFSWTDDQASSWQIAYGTPGFDPDYAENIDYFSTTSGTISGLEDTLSYDFYLRADCGGSQSYWIGPVNARPNLVVMTAGGSDTTALCGGTITDDGGLNGNMASSTTSYLVIRPSDPSQTVALHGSVNMTGTYTYYTNTLYIYEGEGTSGRLIASYTGSSSVNVASTCGALTLKTEVSYYECPGFELNVSCLPLSSCIDPYGINVTDIAGGSATVNWGYSGTTNPNSFAIIVTDTATSSALTFTAPDTARSFLISGLEQTTGYRVEVYSDCGSDTSNHFSTYFKTPCYIGGEVQVAEGTAGLNSHPICTYYNYSTFQMLYPADELTQLSDTIYGVKFYANSIANSTRNMVFFLTTTNVTSLSSGSSFVPQDSANIVWSGTITPVEGFNEIIFTTPFVRTNHNLNLLMTIDDNTGSNNGYTYWAGNNNISGRVLWQNNNTTNLDPTTNISLSTTNYFPTTWFLAPCGDASCVAPVVVYGSSTANTATINWVPGSTETSWTVEYKLASDSTWTVFEASTSANTSTITGLYANSLYDFRVGSLCLAGSSVPYGYTQGRTGCDVMTLSSLPYTEDFEAYSTGDQANCWIAPVTGTSGSGLFPSVYHHAPNARNSQNYYEFEFSSSSATRYEIAALPAFDSISRLQFDFYLGTSSSNCDLFEVGVWEDTVFVPVDTIPLGTGITNYVHHTVYFTNYAGPGQRIAMRASKASGQMTAFVEDVTLSVAPTCIQPLNFVSTGNTSTSIDLAWVNGTPASEWELAMSTQDFTPVSGTIVTTNNYTVTGLTAGQSYTFYVRSICTPGDSSAWVGPVTATPGTWNMRLSQSDTITMCGGVIYDNGGETGNYASYSNDILVVRPNGPGLAVNLTGTYNVQSNYEHLYIYEGEGTNGSLIGDYNGTGNLNVTSNTGSLTIHFTSDGYTQYSGYQLYTSCVSNTCPAVTGLTATGTTSSSITIDWNPTGSESTWEVVAGGVSHIVSAYPYTINGLDALANYTISVRPICNVGDTGAWVYTTAQTDMCDAPIIAINYDSTLATGTSNNSPANPYYNNSYAEIIIDADHLADITGDITAFAFNTANTVGGNHMNNCIVYMAHTTDSVFSDHYLFDSTFVPVYSGNLNFSTTGWQIFGFDTPFTYDGESNIVLVIERHNGSYVNGQNFAAHNAGQDVFRTRYSYSDTQYLTAGSITGGTNSSIVPDIQLISCGQGCGAPSSIAVTNVNYEGATISWSGNAAAYEVAVTPISNANWPAAVTVTANSYTINGLYPATTYAVRIRGNCDTLGTSSWREAYFTTDSLPCFVPENLVANASGVDFVTLNWSMNGQSLAQTWVVNIFNSTTNIMDTVRTRPATISGLYDNTQYYVAIQSVCSSIISSDWSDTISFTTTTCSVVGNVSVSNVTTNGATVTWTAGAGETSWEVNYGRSGFGEGQGTIAATTSTTYQITGLAEDEDYDVYVRAKCAEGIYSNWSPVRTFTTLKSDVDGIDGVDGNYSLSIYPNPATSSTTISLRGIEGEVTVTVVDMNGRTISSDVMNCGADCVKTMTVDGLAQGTYFVRVLGDGINSVRKLIVR